TALGAAAVVLYILFTVLLGGGNVIGNLAAFLCVVSGIFGLIRPRNAMYYLAILAAYNDLIKRLMIFDGRFGMIDIMWVRGLCPMTLAGIFVGTLVKSMSNGNLLVRRNQVLLFMCFSAFALSGISAARSAGPFSALTQLADGAAYLFLAAITPLIFSKPGDLIKYFKFVLIVFVPVALYGVKQQIFGLSAFEIDYLKSGYTSLSKHLMDERPRPFSTLTDSSPFGTSMAVCACLALMIRYHYRKNGKPNWRLLGIVFFLIYVVGCVVSLTRFATLNWVLPILAVPLLSSKKATISVYLLMTAAFLGACYFATDLKAFTDIATENARDVLGDSGLGEQIARFNTLGARLDGMHDLFRNPRMWTPFGYGTAVADEMLRAKEVNSHDIISTTLLHIGWVPIIPATLVIIWILMKLHSSLLKLVGSPVFGIAVWMTGTIIGLCIHNVFAGNVTATFPVNYFFWLLAGSFVTCVNWDEMRLKRSSKNSIKRVQSDHRWTIRNEALAPLVD
ncbi:MAG: hypothetical protein KDK99_17275, partial [Verrucomicrobiales bacterium]|nr:hypothetical protein [Verrucomicrobiales bacterium]